MGLSIRLGNKSVGVGDAPYVIAEISANHRSSKSHALEIIAAAAEAGVDAVKFQHYTPDTITVRSEHSDFLIKGGTLWDNRQLYDLYSEAMTPWDWTDDLVRKSMEVGLDWFSSPFDLTAVDFLENYSPMAYKVASFELVDLPLIRYIASKGRPVIMSTGMANVTEIDAAVSTVTTERNEDIALLKCNSGYPAEPSEMNLSAIPYMLERWKVPVGLSDHTMSATAATVAVALGACIIEKHVTLRRSDGGPDSSFSLEPHELATLVRTLREAHLSLGTQDLGPSPREKSSLTFRRSLRAVRPIGAGSVITHENVRSIRPAGGLPPDRIQDVVGMIALRDFAVGDPITLDGLHNT